MLLLSKRCLVVACALVALCALPARSFASTIAVSGTISDTPDASTPGLYDYAITLTNTGAPIGTFWFAWVPGGNFLTPGDLVPASITEPAGWSLTSDNNSIRSEFSNSAGDPSSTLTFRFDSTETPAQLLGNFTVANGAFAGTYPDLTSFAFLSNSSSSTANPAAYEQFVVTNDLTITPEPGSLLLLLTGILFLAALRFHSPRSRVAL